ncbi:putative arabinose efflux permease, MFS family [Thermodesulfobium acidiphilum]|uniref:Putative arabinose efflux permease, MFS family n=1 Tax=Thermodesulfobium acidiphilum TaxID=1794699 RepID=A0A2R4W2Q4_THEAF|nr:MFS transporter [Thermodesulfobium acidiphilum]AWB10952.1 putative arabinose efflux permease, MFS family [Thermodesulfobium acidiphilum]
MSTNLSDFIPAPLKQLNFSLYFWGQGISLVGSWIQSAALSWLVYKITSSTSALGLLTFSAQVPMAIFTLFGGDIADTFQKKKILYITQTAFTFVALLMFLATIEHANFWFFIMLTSISGFIAAFDMPTRQAFVVELVDKKEDLPQAIALNSGMFNAARIIGPTIAGFLVALFGEAICFLINAISFLAVLTSLFFIKTKKGENLTKKVGANFKEAYNFTINSKEILMAIAILSMGGFLGISYMVLLPAIAKIILNTNVQGYGLLMGSSGLGSLVAALFLGTRKNTSNLINIVKRSSLLLSASLIGIAIFQNFVCSMIFLFLSGFGLISLAVTTNTLIQIKTPNNIRGKMMSIYSLSFIGLSPFGALVIGFLSNSIGIEPTLILCGFTLLLADIFIFKL